MTEDSCQVCLIVTKGLKVGVLGKGNKWIEGRKRRDSFLLIDRNRGSD